MRQKLAHLSKSKAALVVAVAVALAAVVGTTVGYAAMGKDVTLNVDGRIEHVRATGDTVGDVLSAQGISVGTHDEVAPAVDQAVNDGTTIAVRYGKPLQLVVDGDSTKYWVTATDVRGALDQIDRSFDRANLSVSRGAGITRDGLRISVATPKRLTFVIGGKKATHRTVPAYTVGQALQAMHLELGKHDVVKPGLHHTLQPGDRVVLNRIRIVRKHVDGESMPFTTVTRDDSSMASGASSVVRGGRAGLRDVTYRVTFRNGHLVARRVLSQDVLRRAGRADRARGHQDRVTRLRRREHGLGPPRTVRGRRQLGHQHRQRLLRRPAVLARHVACVRRVRPAEQRLARDADRHRHQGPQRQRRVRRLAGLRRLARPAPLTHA